MTYRSTSFAAAFALPALLLLAACNPVTAPPGASIATEATVAHQEGNTMSSSGAADAALPAEVADLQAAYGPPSQAAFGSAVFFEPHADSGDLPAWALEKYKYFVGDLWERYGEEAWLGPWRQVYVRQVDTTPDIVAELRAIDDPDAARSVPMILDDIDGAEQARAALSAAFDDPAMREVVVFNLGDGEAMSGLLVAGRRPATGEALFLVFLLD